MGYFAVNNRKVTEWVDYFANGHPSPTGNDIYMIDVKDRRDTTGSIAVWYSVNDELKRSNDYVYQGFLRSMNAFEDPETLEQFLLVDLVEALDGRFPKDFYTGLDEYIRDNYFPFTVERFWRSQLVADSDRISFEGLYLDNCGFFNGRPAYINRAVFKYDIFNDLFQNPPATKFDEQKEKFCPDILRIGDCLREQYIDAFESYAIEKGYRHLLKLDIDDPDFFN